MSDPAPGIYVHFPYCAQRCHYCDFNVCTPRRIPQRRFTDALICELELRADPSAGPAPTLYLGGGTPSRWEADELARFLDAVRRSPGLRPGAELTLEANPDDVDPDRLARWTALGVNRISLGVQALDDSLLTAAGRAHDSEEARAAIELLRGAGLASWSVDLIFGLPGQTPATWRAALDAAVALEVPHLSVYGLTVEPRTTLRRAVDRRAVVLPDDDAQLAMFEDARRILRAAGYAHYEVSNYARAGHRAVHNTAYWHFRPYLGLGPGAHGFLPPRRWENIRRASRWIEALERGRVPTEAEERPDPATLAYERLMTGLRLIEDGVDLGPDFSRFADAIEEQRAAGMLQVDARRICLTDQGLRYMNDVLLALL